MSHKPGSALRVPFFISLPALGLSAALGAQSAEAAPDQMILMPPAQTLPLLILPGEEDPESLGSDDGDFDSGDGGIGCEGECPGDGEGDGEGDGGFEYEREFNPPEAPDAPLSAGATRPRPVTGVAPVIGPAPPVLFAAANEFCSAFVPNERIDCLRDEYQTIARSLPATPEFAPMRQALEKAAADLDKVVRQNADPAARPARKQVKRRSGTRATATAIRPVAPARLAAATAQADAVLDTLATTLLRSAASAGAQRVAYQQAAQAVNSAKVLLRST